MLHGLKKKVMRKRHRNSQIDIRREQDRWIIEMGSNII